ncbi:DUF3078 domain-containing protein [Vaginella massiliensis]|uniref:DUF3078 domain-containing protein n=1 Tax=Vaginella massiliensis TaxID=1816680 RepID=UPI003750169A
MKKFFASLLMLGLANVYAQTVDENGLKTDSKRYLKEQNYDGRTAGWFISGNNSLLFSQSAFDNWVAGGVNSFSLNGTMDYEFNLTRGKHIWDNRVILGYGILANKGEEQRKTNDIIDLTSSYGYSIGNHWYLAAMMNFKTQFTTGYDYTVDPKEKISNFMAPGYLSFGLGVDYKPNENFQVNIHPVTPRWTLVTDKDLQYAGNFGLEKDGDSSLFEFGAYLGARYKLQIMEGITYDNRLGIYANYLDKPQNMDIAYAGVLDMKVNKWISAQVAINLLYDEDQIKRTQMKQTLGIGFNYKFDNQPVAEVDTALMTEEIPYIENDEPVLASANTSETVDLQL